MTTASTPNTRPRPDAQCLEARAIEAQRNAWKSWEQYHTATAEFYRALLAETPDLAETHFDASSRHHRQAIRLDKQAHQLVSRPCRCGSCVDYRPQALQDAR